MICITGDVHHYFGGIDQLYLDVDEAKCAEQYCKIAQEYGLKLTLFFTGKAFAKNSDHINNLIKFKNLEIGGHTWSAFQPRLLHSAFHIITGSRYGPIFYQDRDIRKTIDIIEKKTGNKTICWRTHAYDSDANTFKLLEKYGVKVVSDEVNENIMNPARVGSLISLPINIMPDHEHIYHGYNTSEKSNKWASLMWVKFKNQLWSYRGHPLNNTPTDHYTTDQYYKIIISQIKYIEKMNGLATILLHPMCMKISDDFAMFTKLCKYVKYSKQESIWPSDIMYQTI